jgi:anaerobic selenocysteine-containing dehydrogenase
VIDEVYGIGGPTKLVTVVNDDTNIYDNHAPMHYEKPNYFLKGKTDVSHCLLTSDCLPSPDSLAHAYRAGWDDTDLAVMWAQSITGSYGWAGPQSIENKKRGTKLVVIDPVRIDLYDYADMWIRPRHGTDCWLVLSMANVIVREDLYDKDFISNWCVGWDEMVKHVEGYTPEATQDITGVPADQVREFCRMFASAPSSYLADGNGIDQQVNSVQTARAIALLRALVGRLDAPRSELFRVPAPFKRVGLLHMLPKDVKRVGGTEASLSVMPEVPTPTIMDAVLTEQPYPVKALIVQGGNPAVVVPNSAHTREALAKVGFLAVHDFFQTRTTEYADVILPAAT